MIASGANGGAAEPLWVATPGAAGRLARQLASAPRLALDTEANGFHAYRPRLCLVQLAWEVEGERAPRVALVDPLALEDELGALRSLLEDPEREVVIHGADYDIRLLKRDAGIAVRGLFDTQLAARFAGRERTSLVALAGELAGMRLSKSSQSTDWARRPLPERALGYAADDVRVLFPIRDALLAELEELGRAAWAAEECLGLEKVMPGADADAATPELQLDKLPGAGRLDPARRAVLLELLRWRDGEARRRDRPPGFIVPNKPLLGIARGPAMTRDDLRAADLPPRVAERYGRAILRAAAAGRDAPPVPAPAREERGRPGESEELRARVKRLRRVRDDVARAVRLDPGLVTPTAMLRAIAREMPGELAGLREAGMRLWQCDLLGEQLLAAVRS